MVSAGPTSASSRRRPRRLHQYNVLKVARRLFLAAGEARHSDFYELAINNGILGNQNREADGATSYIYMQAPLPLPLTPTAYPYPYPLPPHPTAPLTPYPSPHPLPFTTTATSSIHLQPLGGPSKKPWGKSDYGFPCCWGTLSESFAKLTDSIYFTANATPPAATPPPATAAPPAHPTLYVNQYVDSTVAWSAVGVTLEQKADLAAPTSTASLTVRLASGAAATFAMKLRVPGWLKLPGRVTINGEAGGGVGGRAGYLTVDRAWADGDVIDVWFPPSLWTSPLNDYHAWHNATLAFMYRAVRPRRRGRQRDRCLGPCRHHLQGAGPAAAAPPSPAAAAPPSPPHPFASPLGLLSPLFTRAVGSPRQPTAPAQSASAAPLRRPTRRASSSATPPPRSTSRHVAPTEARSG